MIVTKESKIISVFFQNFEVKTIEVLFFVNLFINCTMPDKRKEAGSSSSSMGSSEKNTGGPSAKKAKLSSSTGVHDVSGQANSESLTYDPVHFIRSHSKNNDPADIQTQVTSFILNAILNA